METLFPVRYEVNNCILYFPYFGPAMAQAVSRRPLTVEAGFDPTTVHVRIVVDKVEQVHVFLQAFRFSPVTTILSVLHTPFLLHVAVTRRTNGRNLGTFQNAALFRMDGAFHFVSSS